MKKLFLLTVLFALCSSCDLAESEVHLIPAGYVGTVYIFHDRPDGVPLKYDGRARLYEIPSDGILWSQSSENLGWHRQTDFKYFYVMPDGTRKPLPFWDRASNADPAEDVIGIYARRNGSMGPRPNYMVDYAEYYVGTKASLKSYVDRDVWPYLKARGLCQ